MKNKIEIFVTSLYTFIVLKLIYPSLLYSLPNEWGDFLDTKSGFDFLNTHLTGFVAGLFLSALLIIYSRHIARKYEAIVLTIYTLLDLKLLSTPLFNLDVSFGGWNPLYNNLQASNVSLTLFIGLFLNAALIIYWLRRDDNHSGITH